MGCGLAVAAVSVIGVAIAGHSAEGLGTVNAIATFATNVFGGLGVDALKRLYTTCVERPGRPIDENHVILRNLRAAQLLALTKVIDRFEQSQKTDWDTARAAKARMFSRDLRDYVTREEGRIDTLTAADLAEPTEADASAVRQAVIARAPVDFNAALSARHGAGPAIERFRTSAEAALLAELGAELQTKIPEAFEMVLSGGPDGTDGWFAFFIRDAAKRLRADAAFERIWQGEQTAAIRVLAETIGADVTALQRAIDGHTQSLKALGTQLDEIAGDARAFRFLMSSIADRLDDTRSWLYFNAAFEPEGWLRFHAFNRAIPFQGRGDELAALHEFLNHPDPFRWWIVTAPGGAGKTRLALELCLRAHVNGWQVGFLQKPFTPPAVTWLPRAPTLIIADYAAEQVDRVRALAVQLAQMADAERPVVRLLLLERQGDEGFWQRFLSSYGGEAGVLVARRHDKTPVALPELSEEDVWALVQPCPWRPDGHAVQINPADFFQHLERIDIQRRALVAMLLADAAAEAPDRLNFATLNDVLAAVLRRSRRHHWPRSLGAENHAVGRAMPADILIAAATMAGQIDQEEIYAIESWLGMSISDEVLDDCARAIGSPLYPDKQRLDGIQPDLIGEFFVLEALADDRRGGHPYPWLPELAWYADEVNMAAFVQRARQNFPGHVSALSRIGITVPGKTESWWLSILPLLMSGEDNG